MAKNHGTLNFTGSIGDRTYYNLKGVGPIIRKKQGPSKADMDNNSNFAVTKQNNKEFGCAATAAKALRMGLGQIAKEFQDTTLSGRLAGKVRAIIQHGEGTTGQRLCNFHRAPGCLIGFPLSVANNFKRTFHAPYQCTVNDQRTAITVHIPNAEDHHHGSKPKYATYFKLTAALSLVSNYRYEDPSSTYLPIVPQQNGIGSNTETQPLQLGKAHNNNELILYIPDSKPLDVNVSATIWLGITYLTKDNLGYQSMQSQKAMECVAIF
jgi:hypothetical protein